MLIQDSVRSIVNNASGGIKFLELLANLVAQGLETESPLKSEINVLDPKFPEYLEKTIESMPDMRILKYGWAMGGGFIREKMFVYTHQLHSNPKS